MGEGPRAAGAHAGNPQISALAHLALRPRPVWQTASRKRSSRLSAGISNSTHFKVKAFSIPVPHLVPMSCVPCDSRLPLTRPVCEARTHEVTLDFPFLLPLTSSHSRLPTCPLNTLTVCRHLSIPTANDLAQVLVSLRKGLCPNSCSSFSSALSSGSLPEPAQKV